LTRRLHLALLALWTLEVCLITVGSLLPAGAIPFQQLPGDKWLHFTGYFVAAVLAPFAFERKRLTVFIALGLVGLGAALEWAQKYSPGRSCDLRDMVANTLGVATGFLLGLGLRAAIAALWPRRQC
jgi:VanZ family protein